MPHKIVMTKYYWEGKARTFQRKEQLQNILENKKVIVIHVGYMYISMYSTHTTSIVDKALL